ncbi:hypothetical protein [Rhodohalobacter sp.]|uniref:hypothetical protein n=1 Tax=Rhodohalobacter sp. TaxID=1974210 RepID=UPI002ACECC6D|nr:hypothetical protein [Rhodohalobacter sp.]MDZ7756339.1 hypothetical protein [Rhodohalobacter sp.]
MQKLILFLIAAVGLLSISACDMLTISDDALEYPTVYSKIELGELQSLNEEYHELNNGRLCSTLNEYGFTGFSEILFVNGQNPCERVNRNVVRIEMTNTDTLLSAAKRVLYKNREFTGIQDTNRLRLKSMSPQPGCINCGRPDEYSANIEWSLTFENQYIDLAEVLGTEITVFLDALGVNRIWGNWYSNFKIPDFVNFGYVDVQEEMAGMEIDLLPFTGIDTTYIVQPQDLQEIPTKVHYPIERNNGEELEIRTCWAIPISYRLDETFPGWIAYVDIEEGIIVDLVTRFSEEENFFSGQKNKSVTFDRLLSL